jgi:hypothetical protein
MSNLLCKRIEKKLVMMVHTCNPNIQDVETEEL